MKRIKPSEVMKAPNAYPDDHPTTVRFPLGELVKFEIPVMFGFISRDDIRTTAISPKDGWSAQGIEGACEIRTTWAKAYILARALSDYRGTIIV